MRLVLFFCGHDFDEITSMNKTDLIQLAHVSQNLDGSWREHALEDHLIKVADKAGAMASGFEANDWAYLAGLWHDLGKYSPRFQAYIRQASGYDPEAHIEGGGRVDHSTAGAIHACERLGPKGRMLAYLIAGHHAGLPDWSPSETGAAALAHRLDGRIV